MLAQEVISVQTWEQLRPSHVESAFSPTFQTLLVTNAQPGITAI